jgi:Fe-S cluster assembly ATPase SufC
MAPLPPWCCCHSLNCEVVDGDVNWPGYELMEEERDERNKWGIFNQLPRLAMSCPLFIEILF